MKAIVFNTANSITNLDSETQMLKCGYLMVDKLCFAGQLGANLLFEEETKNFGFLRKVQFLYDYLLPETNQTEDKEISLKSLIEFIKIAKEYPKIKNPTQELTLAYNNSRSVFSDWFDNSRDFVLDLHKRVGFSELSALSTESKIETKLLNISMGRYSHSKHESESNAKLILELLFPNNKTAEPLMLMLPLEFNTLLDMLQEEESKEPLEVVDKNEYHDTFECLVHILTMPEIKNLSALQLKALNAELSEPFKIINIKLEEWILFCKKSNSPQEIIENFKTNVYDHFSPMQDVIDKNLTLTGIKNNPSFNAFENNYFIGICPVDLLWIYFELYRIVDKETLYYLKKRYANNKSYPEFLPILHIFPELIGEENTSQENKKNELDNNHKKKYLKIE